MRTSINEIVDWFYEEEDFRKLIHKHIDKDLVDDAYQEIAIIIINYDRSKIINLYNKNQLKYFIIRIILNTLASSTSPFYYKYVKNENNNIDLEEVDYYLESDYKIDYTDEIEFEKNKQDLIIKVKEFLNNKKKESINGWHDSEIFKMHKFDNKTFRQIQNEFNIHYTYAFRAKERMQEQIKEIFEKEYNNIKNKKQ